MKTIRLLSMIAAFALLALTACEDDPAGPQGGPPPLGFQNLTQKWHVLSNIELAYTKRNLERYDQLLDNDFTFFLSAGDVGGDVPESWDRTTEVQANTNLFSIDQPPAPLKRVLTIDMDIHWEDDKGNPNITWIEFTPPNSSETWCKTTVIYDFKIDVEGDLTYINNPGAQAQFTVRNAGTEEAPVWKLVEFRDLGSD